MLVIESPAAMREWADGWRATGRRIGFVPTMGYLHDGHVSLMTEARRRADVCVVSIFVNPLQFGTGEDLSKYPRDLDRDRAALAHAGVDALYLPSAERMYPGGFQTEVAVGALAARLCGRSRPGHFRGVATVVAKLFNAVKPHVAVFGEKDFQQLAVIRRMTADLDLGIEIVGMPIVREPDGVAMSSRNAYLSPRERTAARCLPRALAAARAGFARGARGADALLECARAVLAAEPLARLDYAELVDAETMEPVETVDRPVLLALAVCIGRARLIDNTVLTPASAALSASANEEGPARGAGLGT
jgi:pantoate--beta-alanine ligase